MDLEQIERRTGLRLLRRGPEHDVFIHPPTKLELSLVPGGSFVMGISAEELLDAWQVLDFDPGSPFWRDAYEARYREANPLRVVTVHPFLCGRSPLLAEIAEALGLSWSTLETKERAGPRCAADLSKKDAAKALSSHGFELISEAQWEWVARSGGRHRWVGGSPSEDLPYRLSKEPIFDPDAAAEPWGVWGLHLGEWIADDWHPSYEGAPETDAPWRSRPGLAGTVRGGAARHAPWQDSDEAFACHVGVRGRPGSKSRYVARPVLRLPWLSSPPAEVRVAPTSVPFEEVLEAHSRAFEAKQESKRQRERERREKMQRLAELPGTLQQGKVRSVGEGGVYIVSLAAANGVLRLEQGPKLEVGQAITVRVVGTGRVPEVQLVDSD